MNSSDAVDLTQRSLLPPPPGVKSNFANPETRGDTYKPVIIGFATLGTVAVLLRLYARARIVRKIGPDDCMSDVFPLADETPPADLGSGTSVLAMVRPTLLLAGRASHGLRKSIPRLTHDP